jgi:HEPN domain-containing protein
MVSSLERRVSAYKLAIEDDIAVVESYIEAKRFKSYNPVVLHSEQIVEKSLKFYLIANLGDGGNGHDLVVLCDSAAKINCAFQGHRELCAKLQGIYITSHYPTLSGNYRQYEYEEAMKYYNEAMKLYDFINEQVKL